MHRVVLTFDDGPHPENTPRVLDLLAKENVKAVFFTVGERLQAPGALDIVRRATREGHLIGNHSFSHPKLTEVSPEDVRSQIARTQQLISEFEPKHKLFRPPYGAHNNSVKAIAKKLKYKTVLWNVDSGDWKAENQPSAWVDVAVEQISKRYLSICLLHDYYSHTAAHLPQLLEKLKRLPDLHFVRYENRRDFRSIAQALWDRSTMRVSRLVKSASHN